MVFHQGEPPNGGGGEKRKARIVWDDATRQVFASLIAETTTHAVDAMIRRLGVDPGTHADHHRDLPAIIEWVRADKTLKEKKARFWQHLVEDRFLKPAIVLGGWLIIAAIIFGMSGAVHWLAPLVREIVAS